MRMETVCATTNRRDPETSKILTKGRREGSPLPPFFTMKSRFILRLIPVVFFVSGFSLPVLAEDPPAPDPSVEKKEQKKDQKKEQTKEQNELP